VNLSDSTYFRVSPLYWRSAADHGWDDTTKLVGLYVLTAPHRITEGLFRLPVSYVVEDMEISRPRAEKALARLAGDGLIERDGDMVLIVNALIWQPPKAGSNITHAVRKAKDFRTPLLARLLELARDLSPGFAEALVKAKPELSAQLSAELSTSQAGSNAHS
jgi:hypothetical protein